MPLVNKELVRLSIQSPPYTGVKNLEAMTHAHRYNRFLLDLILSAGPESPVVDFGAGLGMFSAAMAERGFAVTAIEPDFLLRRELQARGLQAVENLADLPDSSARFIFSFNVLEHIEDDAGALKEMLAKLQPGGRLLLYVPAFDVLFSKMDKLVGHVRRYKRDGLIRQLGEIGFAVERARYADSLGFFATLAFKWFDRGGGEISAAEVKTYDRFVFPASRWLDKLFFSRFLGKNVFVIAQRPLQKQQRS